MFNETNNLTSKLEVMILPLYKTFSIVVKMLVPWSSKQIYFTTYLFTHYRK